jgi:hypothetical protein
VRNLVEEPLDEVVRAVKVRTKADRVRFSGMLAKHLAG